MGELNKRLITSFVLGVIFFFSILSEVILIFVLIIIFIQLYFEFYSLINKILSKKQKFLLFLISFLILIYIFIFILCIAINFLDKQNNNFFILMMSISVCIASDIGGYVFGKFFKGKKLTSISPKKTYSGLFGAYILSVMSSYLIFYNFFSLNYIITFSVIVSTVSQSGDLFVSYLKRKAKLKDTGEFLPGHGGLLDRLDGILFAIPFALALNLYQ
tara:strand:+ start:617 stop:1264 length:648 start_codon:yes stop_codon:yes gene_type:complete